jgi:hypothetical protein
MVIGALGGLSLIVVGETTTKGEAIYWPYTILVLELVAMLGLSRGLTNRQRLLSFITGFMVASLILYAWLILWVNPAALSIPLAGHAWRLGFLLGIAGLLGAGATALTRSRAKT